MALFTGRLRADYAQPHMPQPAQADGPWGEAIVYWLNARRWRQADLARETGIEPKTISSVTRGFHTTTRILQRIAEALQIPLDAVLVSPDRKSANEQRKQMIQEITERVVRHIEAPAIPGVTLPPNPSAVIARAEQRLAEEVARLPPPRKRKKRKKLTR